MLLPQTSTKDQPSPKFLKWRTEGDISVAQLDVTALILKINTEIKPSVFSLAPSFDQCIAFKNTLEVIAVEKNISLSSINDEAEMVDAIISQAQHDTPSSDKQIQLARAALLRASIICNLITVKHWQFALYLYDECSIKLLEALNQLPDDEEGLAALMTYSQVEIQKEIAAYHHQEGEKWNNKAQHAYRLFSKSQPINEKTSLGLDFRPQFF